MSLGLSFILIISSACKAQTVLLSTINWPPYTGEKLEEHGFFSEIVSGAFSEVGYEVEFQYRPWPRALQEAKTGVVDGVMTAYWKSQRTAYLEYPDVVWKVTERFFTLYGHPILNSSNIEDLIGYRIGVLRGSLQAEQLMAYGIDIEEVNSHSQNILKLSAGRIDAVIIPDSVLFYELRSLSAEGNKLNFKKLDIPYRTYKMYVAFSKVNSDYKKLTEDFNQGLKLLKNNGEFERIQKKHNIKKQ